MFPKKIMNRLRRGLFIIYAGCRWLSRNKLFRLWWSCRSSRTKSKKQYNIANFRIAFALSVLCFFVPQRHVFTATLFVYQFSKTIRKIKWTVNYLVNSSPHLSFLFLVLLTFACRAFIGFVVSHLPSFYWSE